MSTRDQKNVYVPPHRRFPRENGRSSGSTRTKHIPHLSARTNCDDPSEMTSDTNLAIPQTAQVFDPVAQTRHGGTNDLGSDYTATVSSSTDRSTLIRSLNPIPELHTQIATSSKRKRKIRAYPELQNLHQEALACAERAKDSGHLPVLLPSQAKKPADYSVPMSLLKDSVIADTGDDRASKAHEKSVHSSAHDEDLVEAMQGLKVFSNLRPGVQTLGMNSKHISDESFRQKQRDQYSSEPLEGRTPTIVDNGQVGGQAFPVSTNTNDMIFSNTHAATRVGTISKDSIRDVIVDTERSTKQFPKQIPASLTALANTDALTTKVAIGGSEDEGFSLEQGSEDDFEVVALQNCQSQRNGRPSMWGRWFE